MYLNTFFMVRAGLKKCNGSILKIKHTSQNVNSNINFNVFKYIFYGYRRPKKMY